MREAPFVPIAEWLEKFYCPLGRGKPIVLHEPWRRVLVAAFTPDPVTMKLPYTTVILSAVKKCLVAGERLWLADGRFVPVETLIGQTTRVWAYDEAASRYVAADAEIWNAGEEEVLEIELWSGRTIRRSAGHRVMAWNGWTPVNELEVGQKIALPLTIAEPEHSRTDLTPDLARALGYLIGDGGLTGRSTPSFTQNPGAVLDDLRAIGVTHGFQLTPKGNLGYYVVGSAVAICRNYDMLERNSYQHRVPDAVWQSSNLVLANFLAGLYATDGWVVAKAHGSKKTTQVGYSSMSRGLAEDLQALLCRFGIFATLRTKKVPGRLGDRSYEVIINGAHEVVRFASAIGIPGKEACLAAAVRLAESRWMHRARWADQLCPRAFDDLARAREASGRSWTSVIHGVAQSTWAANRLRIASWARGFGAQWLAQKAERPFAWDAVTCVRSLGRQPLIAVTVPGYGNHLAHEVTANSGKSLLGGGIALWFANNLSEPGGEILCIANKREQAKGRAFLEMQLALEHMPLLKNTCRAIQSGIIQTANGTRIYPITTEAGGEAGANPEMVIHDELWDWGGGHERLWTELTPVPTRRNSLRLIITYAGYAATSTILYREYQAAMACPPHPDFLDLVDGAGKPVVRADPERRIFCLWDHIGRMPWQTNAEGIAYYRDQERKLPPSEFRRIHCNEWSSGEEGIDMDLWDLCVDPTYDPERTPAGTYLAAGCDASYKKDLTAVVSAYRRAGMYYVGPLDMWKPRPKEQDFDLEGTAEAFIQKLRSRFRLGSVFYDPYQFHTSALRLKRQGIRMIEWKQTEPNKKVMGNKLTELLRQRKLVLPPDPRLREQAASVTLKLSPEGLQINKDSRNKKIDAITALAMALVAAERVQDMAVPIGQSIMVLD